MNNLSGAAARGGAAILLSQAARLAIQTLGLLILARLLTPYDYGVVAMATSLVGLAAVLTDLGLSLAAMQAQNLTREQQSNLFWLNTALGVVLAAIVFLGADPIANFYDQPRLAAVTRSIAPVFIMGGMTAQYRALLTRELRFRPVAYSDSVSQAIGLFLATLLALDGFRYWSLVAQQLTVAVVTLAWMVLSARWLPGLPRRGQRMRPLLSFGINTVATQAINYISVSLPTIMLGRYWGTIQAGNFNRAYTLFTLPMNQLTAPLTRVSIPILSRVAHDQMRFEKYVLRAQLLLAYGLVGIFAFCIALAEPTVTIILGHRFLSAVPIFRILAIGGVFQAVGYIYYWVFLAIARPGLQLRIDVYGRIIMMALEIALLPLGPVGVAAGLAAGLLVLWVLSASFGMKRASLSAMPITRTAWMPLVTYAVAGGVAYTCDHLMLYDTPSLVRLLAGLGVFGLVALVMLVAIPVGRRDVALLQDALAQLRKGRVRSGYSQRRPDLADPSLES